MDLFEHAHKMDRIYRYQRYIYDWTRILFLFGRDSMLNQMQIQPGDRVLEMGCGTGRNLLKLAKKFPGAFYYGVDISQEMLKTSLANIRRAGLQGKISCKATAAEETSYQNTFELDRPFDRVFFSYSLSMIPNWQEAIRNALENLRIGGFLDIVDFGEQAQWPGFLRDMFLAWLQLFGVKPAPGLPAFLHSLDPTRSARVTTEIFWRGYFFKLRLQKYL